MSSLDTLFPAPVTLEVAGVTVEVRELTVSQLPGFLRAAAPVLSVLADEAGFDLVFALSNTAALIDSVEIATGVDRGWLDGLPIRELLRLTEAVVEANADFFAVALPAFIANLAARTARMTAGLTPSNGLLRTDIDGRISGVTP